MSAKSDALGRELNFPGLEAAPGLRLVVLELVNPESLGHHLVLHHGAVGRHLKRLNLLNAEFQLKDVFEAVEAQSHADGLVAQGLEADTIIVDGQVVDAFGLVVLDKVLLMRQLKPSVVFEATFPKFLHFISRRFVDVIDGEAARRIRLMHHEVAEEVVLDVDLESVVTFDVDAEFGLSTVHRILHVDRLAQGQVDIVEEVAVEGERLPQGLGVGQRLHQGHMKAQQSFGLFMRTTRRFVELDQVVLGNNFESAFDKLEIHVRSTSNYRMTAQHTCDHHMNVFIHKSLIKKVSFALVIEINYEFSLASANIISWTSRIISSL